MEEWAIFVAGAFFLVTISTAMARLGKGWGGQAWAGAWACLWVAGFGSVFSAEIPAARPLAPILGTCFNALLVRGTCCFTATGVDRWRPLVAAAIGFAIARVTIDALSPGVDELVGSVVTTAGVGLCCWLFLHPADRDPTPWERVLASLFPAIATVAWYYAILWSMSLPSSSSVFAWLTVGVVLCSLKTGAFVARSGERLARLQERAHESEHDRESIEARYREVAENASDLIAEVDSFGRFLYANPAFQDILGFKPESLLGRSAEQLLFSREALVPNGKAPRARIEPQTLVVRHADGRPITLECHLRRFTLANGETGIVVTGRDVTARTAQEDRNSAAQAALQAAFDERTAELRSSLAELQQSQRLASLGTMAAGVAHQINNPIGSILLASEFALATPEDERDEAWRDALENSVDQARRCGRIVSSMLQFARNETTAKATEDLSAILRRACDQTERQIGPAEAVIDAADLESPLPIYASAIELEQAFLNVLRNACESSDGVARVEVRARRSGPLATVTIADDGRGMSPGEVEHVFDPFYTTRLGRGGTGLGLSVAHGIVTDHEGLVSIESEPGRGTTIAITLPLHAPEAKAESEAI